MTKETMNVHKALCELKLLDKRIESTILMELIVLQISTLMKKLTEYPLMILRKLCVGAMTRRWI